MCIGVFVRARLHFVFFCSICFLGLISCSSSKPIAYFDGVVDSKIESAYSHTDANIRIDDLLSITVRSLNPKATDIFNAPNESASFISSTSTGTVTQTVGYLVDKEGYIVFPFLGRIQVAGKSKAQLNSYLTTELVERKLLVDPIVTIRQLNFRVSVLGEVLKPGVYSTANEKITILEALSFAGDLTMYGKKDNILLIREDKIGEKEFKRLNLTNQEIFNSPYYYLHSNDIVYVEATQDRVKREKNALILPVFFSVISLLIVAFTSFTN